MKNSKKIIVYRNKVMKDYILNGKQVIGFTNKDLAIFDVIYIANTEYRVVDASLNNKEYYVIPTELEMFESKTQSISDAVICPHCGEVLEFFEEGELECVECGSKLNLKATFEVNVLEKPRKVEI